MTTGKPMPPRIATVPHNPKPHPGAMSATLRREPKTLTVGREIILSGDITSCDRLVVEGQVRSSLEDCQSLEIARGGAFRGKAKIAAAEIAGLFEGDLDVEDCLILRATGRIIGTIRYRDMEIERGGRIAGTVEIADEADADKQEDAGPAAKAPHVVT
jgi:cytoskeletal protein CcmA (bactofilin family)